MYYSVVYMSLDTVHMHSIANKMFPHPIILLPYDVVFVMRYSFTRCFRCDLGPFGLLTFHCFQLQEYNKDFLLTSGERYATLLRADQKFLLVPAVFMVLRVWDVLYGVMFLYTDSSGKHKWLIYLDVSVCVHESMCESVCECMCTRVCVCVCVSTLMHTCVLHACAACVYVCSADWFR